MLWGGLGRIAVQSAVKTLTTVAVAATLFTAPRAVFSCDVCGCYLPNAPQPVSPGEGQTAESSRWTNNIYAGVAEQFTHFGTLQFEGNEVSNPTDQHLDSSITQFVIGYAVTPRILLQLNIPLIYRSFQRPEGFAIDHGRVSGQGDISLLANAVLLHLERGGGRDVRFDDPKSPRIESRPADLSFVLSMISGVKMPTGDSERLTEEFHEVEIPGAPPSAIHGHDLTLGTGSWDWLVGGRSELRYKNAFIGADLQFTLRGDGDHQYHFANDLFWTGGPGYYLWWKGATAISLQAIVLGEHKDVDRFRGKAAEDTGITGIFVGPRLRVVSGKISGEIEAALPVSIDNTALQAVADYQIRASISVHF